jgi:TetR/AcrR family transcriptional regulator, transcriptional repressor for nem operon
MANQTRIRLLKEAYSLMCSHGYSAFSYADLAKTIGISKASIHHHFPSKENLGEAVISSAYVDTQQKLQEIRLNFPDFMSRIAQYMALFSQQSECLQLPLCCSLSAEFANLPNSIQLQTQAYFEMQIDWLKEILQSAQETAEINTQINIDDLALTILKLFEGTCIVARVLQKNDIFQQSLTQVHNLIQ